jgi:hypothetical protein
MVVAVRVVSRFSTLRRLNEVGAVCTSKGLSTLDANLAAQLSPLLRLM